MKKFLLAFCTFIGLIVNAQLDNEHWFAPMSASSLQGTPECFLYLSTNETTPFSVQISNNNTVFSTVQVSKNNPVQLTIPNNYMIASTPNSLFTANSMGLHVKGTKNSLPTSGFQFPNRLKLLLLKEWQGLENIFCWNGSHHLSKRLCKFHRRSNGHGRQYHSNCIRLQP